MILETLFPANLLASTEGTKPNIQKQIIHEENCPVLNWAQNATPKIHSKKKPKRKLKSTVNCKNCSHVRMNHCAQLLYTINQVLIIFHKTIQLMFHRHKYTVHSLGKDLTMNFQKNIVIPHGPLLTHPMHSWQE